MPVWQTGNASERLVTIAGSPYRNRQHGRLPSHRLSDLWRRTWAPLPNHRRDAGRWHRSPRLARGPSDGAPARRRAAGYRGSQDGLFPVWNGAPTEAVERAGLLLNQVPYGGLPIPERRPLEVGADLAQDRRAPLYSRSLTIAQRGRPWPLDKRPFQPPGWRGRLLFGDDRPYHRG